MRSSAKQCFEDGLASLWQREHLSLHCTETTQVITMKLRTFDNVNMANTLAKFGWNPPAGGRFTHT